jgi:LSD1 subclass zinc finger protein
MQIDVPHVIDLLKRRQEIDHELQTIFAGLNGKKTVKCSTCQADGHTARTCPQRGQS